MIEYSAAPAHVEDMAAKLIEAHHTHLSGAPIVYLFASEARRSKGKVVMAKARLVTGLNAYLSEHGDGSPFFVLEIAGPEWKELTEEQQEALVDHELCHFGVTDEGKYHLIAHDLEEFVAVVGRHGLWRENLKRMSEAASFRQETLELTAAR